MSNSNTNFDITDARYNIVINPNKINLVLVADSKVYDKTNATISVTATAEEGLTGGEYIQYNVESNNQTVTDYYNVGNYKLVVTLKDTLNFVFNNSNEKAFSVSMANVTISLNTQKSTFGDDIIIDNYEYTVSGIVYTGDDLGVVISKEQGTDAGNYKLTATWSNTNYNVMVNDGNYIIERKSVDLNYIGSDNVTYTGNELDNLLCLDMNGLNGIVQYWYTNSNKLQITKPYVSGDYFLRVKLIDSNYTIGDVDIIDTPIKINAISWEVSINDINKVYDGSTVDIVVTEGVNTLDTSLYVINFFDGNTPLNNAPVNAGTYSVQITPKDTLNYVFGVTEQFVIEQRTVELEYYNYELTFNKQVQKAGVRIINKVVGDVIALETSYTGEGFVNAGNYSISVTNITGEDKNNYKLPETGLSLAYSIDQLKVEMTAENVSFIYTGSRLTADQLVIDFSSEYVDLGDYNVSELPIDVVKGYEVVVTSLTDNIVILNNTLQVEISPADITGIYLTGANYKYNGAERSLSVNTLILPDGNTADVEYIDNQQTEVGEYVVTAVVTNKNYKTLYLNALLVIETNMLNIVYSGSDVYYNNQAYGLTVNTDNLTEDIKSLLSITYQGVDSTYNSQDKPINAGLYRIVVTSLDTNAVQITNPTKEFNIYPKPVSVANLTTQTYTYSANTQSYNVSLIGVVDGDDVDVLLSYNGEEYAINVGTYDVLIEGLIGEDKFNYSITSGLTAMMVINPYTINVTAENKSITYGDDDVDLTYVSNALLGNDVFTGELSRQSGKFVNNYTILQGTLSAGDNYEIVYTSGVYVINPRVLTVNVVEDTFTYTGDAIVPVIEVDNIVTGDTNVYSTQIIGDNIQAGTFKVKVNVLSANYVLSTNYVDITITITKKDVSELILRLVSDTVAYTGEVFTPSAFIRQADGHTLDYDLYVTLADIESQIVNAGQYKVTVIIDDNNYSGSRQFDFEVTPIAPDDMDIVVTANSYSITVQQIPNAVYKIDNGEYQTGNVFNGLEELTKYTITVKLLANGNYTQKVLTPVEVGTTLSPESINQEINSVGEFDITKLQSIKDLVKDLSKVSEDELNEVDTAVLQSLVTAYESYIAGANQDLEDTKVATQGLLSPFGVGIFVSSIITLITLLFTIRLRNF